MWQLPHKECSLLPYQRYWIASKRIVTPQGIISGAGLFSSFSEISIFVVGINLGKVDIHLSFNDMIEV